MATEGRWEQVTGRAAQADRSEYLDRNQHPVIEFSVCHNREGENVWYRVIAKNGCAELAGAEVRKGTKVTIAGRVMDKGAVDKQTGKWRARLVMFLDRLAITGGGEASDVFSGQTAVGLTHASMSEEELAAARAVEERVYPLRWHRPGWAATQGGQQFFSSNLDAFQEAQDWSQGKNPELESGQATIEDIRAMLANLGI